MSRKIRRGDTVFISAIAEVLGDDGEGNVEINMDGFEDGLLATLDDDVSIDGGTLQTGVREIRNVTSDVEALRDQHHRAIEVAHAMLRNEPEIMELVGPWLKKRGI